MKLFSTLIKVCRGTSSSYFKINVPFFCCPLFVKEYLDPLVTIKKMVNQQCRLPPWSFKINLKDKSFHISIDSLGLISLQNICRIFSQSCIFQHSWEKFSKSCCLDYWKMHLRVKKN